VRLTGDAEEVDDRGYMIRVPVLVASCAGVDVGRGCSFSLGVVAPRDLWNSVRMCGRD
jgi:hypothetical protein